MTKTRSKYTGKPRHIEIHDEEEAENTHAQVTRGNTRKNRRPGSFTADHRGIIRNA